MRPLQGLTVLDLTNVLAGPFCCFQLGLLGARIIKVESPDGDLARRLGSDPTLNQKAMGVSFLAQNAGKESITLNLKHPDGVRIFKQLVETADAIVENFRPGVMARLGLDFDTLKTINPRLVYCAISGFGQNGPLSAQPAYDQIVQGLSGVMQITGTPEQGYRVGYPVADTIGGLTAAMAISAALHKKDAQFIDVSMLESLLTTMGWVVSNWLIAGTPPHAHGNENPTSAPSGTFQTGEGALNIAANQDAQWERLCEVLQAPQLLQEPRFMTRELRKQHRTELNTALEHILQSQTATHWAEQLSHAGVPAAVVLSVEDALELEQLSQRQFLQRFTKVAELTEMPLMTAGFLINNTRPHAVQPPDTLGAHTHSILQSLGYEDADIHALYEKGAL
ncbi:MAG: CoA transferase [Gammaproteobacteria bacterium]|nr:CoA transferase [Gammaproteobacteria bacterium]